jgi:maltose alpha-D-glucosyltransferase/alpha-amylase
MRQMIGVRKAHRAFGRGSLEILNTPPGVLAYARRYEGEMIVVANNLSPEPRAVELNLGLPSGVELRDLLSGSAFPPPNGGALRLELERYGYRWIGVGV